MSELKPCPFCGGEAKIVEARDNESPARKSLHFMIYAAQCGSDLDCPAKNSEQDEQGGFDCEFTSVEAAIENWNSRPIEDALQKRIDELEKSVHDQIIEDAERITKLEAIIKSLKEQTSKITDSDDIDDYTMGSIWDTYETD